ncbi:AraC family transcriptional regulator [Rhodocytophaga rosea]|uniref:AraC family transcriptional regulator n=1 Tax=Rhodocytophaga rosea TaxID=2704465 RepID=A0A6C0GKR1_9BACT|nr:helix-turn-helix domain-containing protein [Rhodocytophaga rosea]QHT68253.1 AraC family transcriptional regulator [Rhodocytophaga rosea]
MFSEGILQILTILNLLGAAQGLFMALLVLSMKSANRKASILLATLLFCFSMSIGGATLGVSGYYLRFPHLIRVGDPFVLLLGPLFYLYARSLARYPLRPKELLHFVPFLVYVLSLIPFFAGTATEKIAFVQQMQESRSAGIIVIVVLRLVFLLAYSVITYRFLQTYTARIKENFSNIDKLNLDWLIAVSKLLLLVIVCSVGMYVLILFSKLSFLESNYINAFLVSLVIYAVGFLGVRQSRVFAAAPLPVSTAIPVSIEPAETKPATKYENSTLSQEKSSRYLQKLLHSMQQDKLYLDSELSLQTLADKLSIPPHYLSQVINEQLGQNFFDFVNTYRVEEVKSRLTDPKNQHLTILAIAFDAGFNSKSAFNLAFKSITGFTPSQFRTQHK